MSPPLVPPIGDRIREERAARGVTVRGLAREIGVSASLISQIETGRSQPSVSTLYAIVTALGISIEDLFAPGTASADAASLDVESPSQPADDERGAPQIRPINEAHGAALLQPASDGGEQPSSSRARTVVRQDRGRRVGPVVHADEREALKLETGVVWELLGQVPGIHVDFLRVTYEPGGSSSPSGTLMRHSGIEYGFLISGELILTLAFDEHHLKAGDAISFDSATPHGYRNEGTEPAIGVWFVVERTH